MTSPPLPSESISIPKSTLRTTARAVAGVIVLALVAILVLIGLHALNLGGALPPAVDTHTYQAVFLSNGQVYFGSLSRDSDGFYDLRHVYSLQSSTTLHGRAQPTLTKLTSEVHSPEDLVIINPRSVLYIENLNPHGRAAELLRGSSG